MVRMLPALIGLCLLSACDTADEDDDEVQGGARVPTIVMDAEEAERRSQILVLASYVPCEGVALTNSELEGMSNRALTSVASVVLSLVTVKT